MVEAEYLNNKNETVKLGITNHVRRRFFQRWPAAFPTKRAPLDIDLAIIELFNNSTRHQNFSRKDKTRLRRYGKDTLFFRNGLFTFVVQNATILTVELNSRELRRFNRCSSNEILKYSNEICSIDKSAPASLRLVASTLDSSRLPKFLNLGSYPYQEGNGVTEKLKNDPDFIIHIKEKLAEKIVPGIQLVEILGFYGKNTKKFCIYDQLHVQNLFSGVSC